MELIVFLPISHHLATLNFFFQAFMFLRPFSSLKFRRLSLKTLETRHAGDTIVALLEQHPEWSHTKFTFEEPILDRTPWSTGVFFNQPVLFFFNGEFSNPWNIEGNGGP